MVPQCSPDKSGKKDEWQAGGLDLLFTQLKREQCSDHSRGYLIGYRMGGYGTCLWAAAHPELFAAIEPHAGGLGADAPKAVAPDIANWAKRLALLPIWIFHGDKDDVVPIERSQRMNGLLEAAGARDVRFTMILGKGHGITDNMLNPELYAWLLRHRRDGDKIF